MKKFSNFCYLLLLCSHALLNIEENTRHKSIATLQELCAVVMGSLPIFLRTNKVRLIIVDSIAALVR